MAVSAEPVTHIVVDESGAPRVGKTGPRVVEVVLDHLAHGWSPEEIQRQHYGALSLAEIHAAFTYYYDHQEALDQQISREFAEYRDGWAKNANSPIRVKLRAMGLLP